MKNYLGPLAPNVHDDDHDEDDVDGDGNGDGGGAVPPTATRRQRQRRQNFCRQCRHLHLQIHPIPSTLLSSTGTYGNDSP